MSSTDKLISFFSLVSYFSYNFFLLIIMWTIRTLFMFIYLFSHHFTMDSKKKMKRPEKEERKKKYVDIIRGLGGRKNK